MSKSIKVIANATAEEIMIAIVFIMQAEYKRNKNFQDYLKGKSDDKHN